MRGPGLVFFAGIVGVPWQAIANDPGNVSLGYKPATQLDWNAILGDPANHVPPADPHMVESIDPRPGLPTSGNVDPVFLPWLSELNVETATTGFVGLASADHDPLLLPRYVDTMAQSEVAFESWLSGAGAWFSFQSHH